MSHTILDHTADICLKIQAETLEGLFSCAAEGLLSNIFDMAEFENSAEKKRFSFRAQSREEFLVKFLNELLYNFYSKKMLLDFFGGYGGHKYKFGKDFFEFEADFIKMKKTVTNFEVKAVTYGNLKIEFKNNIFETTVIADV